MVNSKPNIFALVSCGLIRRRLPSSACKKFHGSIQGGPHTAGIFWSHSGGNSDIGIEQIFFSIKTLADPFKSQSNYK